MKRILVVILAAAVVFVLLFALVTRKKAEHTLQRTREEIRNRAIPLRVFSEKSKTKEDGQLLLSANAIHDIVYSEPYYYVATSGGVHLLDASFKTVDHFTTLNGLQAVDVRQIVKGPASLYFLYKDGRFSRYADNRFDHFQAPGLAIRSALVLKDKIFLADHNHVYQLLDDRLQEIASHEHIKQIFGREHLHLVDAENRVFRMGRTVQPIAAPDLQMISNARESADSIFIASSRGLYSSAAHAFLFPGHYVKDCEWHNGTLFALTANGEVLSSRGSDKVISGQSQIFALKRTNGRLFALSSEGFFVSDNGKWRVISLPSALPEPFITTLCQYNGTLWAGTLDRGILAIHGLSRHERLGQSAEINDSLLLNGKPYFASTMGVLVASETKIATVQGSEGMYCNALLADQGEIYAGSSRGLLRLRSAGLELYNLFQKLSNLKIFCLEKVNSGIWCGTMGGLQYFDGHEFSKNLSSLNTPIRDNWISNIKEVNGTTYISTYNGELGEIAGDSIEIIGRPECKFNFNNMTAFRHYLFLGTFDRGIFVINLETKSSAFWRKKLPSSNITDLIISGEKLVAASDSGIYLADLDSALSDLNI